MLGSSHDSANRITGSRPAHDTRFGSSKDARTTGASCRNLISQVPSRTRNRSLSNFYSPSSEGISMPDTPASIEINRWIEAQGVFSFGTPVKRFIVEVPPTRNRLIRTDGLQRGVFVVKGRTASLGLIVGDVGAHGNVSSVGAGVRTVDLFGPDRGSGGM